MDSVWSNQPPVTVRDVLDDLHRERPLAYTTVMTVMDNLHKKGLLTREKNNRAWEYRATMSREQHTAAFMTEVLATAPNRTATMLHFLEQLPPEEAVRLRDALEGHRPPGTDQR